MQAEINEDKRDTRNKLETGLAHGCADDIIEAIINMHNGTCNYTELIPLLEQIVQQKEFYYFDDNGAGGAPHPDLNRKTDFFAWGQRAIDNLKENDRFEASGVIAGALTSNSTELIKSTLEKLHTEGTSTDEHLIPILEKIAAKDEYKSYSYISGFQTDCKLGDLARSVKRIILHNTESIRGDHAPQQPHFEFRLCSVCISLPDDFTVNTGREEPFPTAFRKLKWVCGDSSEAYYRCPGCGTYYEWINMPQFYGSGNCDEERLVRQTPEKSRELEHAFSDKDK